MRVLRQAAFLAALLTLPGCPAAHVAPDDAVVPLPDGGVVRCTVAGMLRCDEACGGRDVCIARPLALCVDGLCIEAGVTTGQGGGCGDDRTWCLNELVCMLRDESVSAFSGACVDGSICDAAAADGYPLDCRWFDGTARHADPPAPPSCPPAPHAATPFCGEGCALCDGISLAQSDNGCFGINDARGLGICGVRYRGDCERGARSGADVCDDPEGLPILDLWDWEHDRPDCACLVIADGSTVDGWSDRGWATSTAGCRAYRDLYPGQVDCVVDRDWSTLP